MSKVFLFLTLSATLVLGLSFAEDILLPDGRKISGQIKLVNGELEGKGSVTRPNGAISEGIFANNQLNGPGTFSWPNGGKGKGNYVNGEKEGFWTITNSDGSSLEGNFIKGKKSGIRVIGLPDGKKVNGKFVNGEFIPDESNIEQPTRQGQQLQNALDHSEGAISIIIIIGLIYGGFKLFGKGKNTHS